MHSSIPDHRILRILAITLFAASCTDGGAPTALDEFGPQSTVTVTYEAGEGSQFAFLEPLVKGVPSGPLATGLTPTITICNISAGPPTGCIDLEAVEETDSYHANWKDKTAQPNETYSIEVFTSFGLRIGSLELLLDGESGDNAGRTFPVKFWVGEGLGDAIIAVDDCIGDDRCNADAVPDDLSGPVVITTQNEAGVTMAQLTFPEGSVPDGGLVVILDCRVGGFAPTEGPLPTALDQWPLFCTITATNPDGTPFLGTLAADAQLDICIVDDVIQPDYHAFPDPDDLVLGKSNGPGDFVFLPKAPSSLLDCTGNTTVTDLGLGDRILHELDTRLAPAFGVLMPEGLRAAPMWFRDGGVGGLIGSFSDVNPVEPAYISGTVSHVSGGIEGVTVTLSGDAAAVATTDEGGFYQFGPLQAAEGGGSNYTITVTPPPGESFADPDIDVVVTGTGTTTVDFETELPAGIFFYAGTGNYYGPVTIAPSTITWSDANAAANAMSFRGCGGHLATITSADETAFALANMTQAADDGYLLGGQFDGVSWTWVTGEEWIYTNWHFGEPSGDGTVLQFFGRWGTPIEEWNDTIDLFPHFGYVVEYSCELPG